jgi:hypothetical protein
MIGIVLGEDGGQAALDVTSLIAHSN